MRLIASGITSLIMIFLLLVPTGLACTVFHVSNDTFAFGGNNEDYSNPDTHIYFHPPSSTSFGKVIVGYTGIYTFQGGMNEKGLFFDGLATPYLEVKESADKPYFNGNVIDHILNTCETCDEALDILDQYNMKILERAQLLIGDRFGDSFIIEGDVIHRKSDYFQVATNFYLSQYPDPPYPCWRYNTALSMFENNPVEDISIDFCASVLDAVHQEGAYPTQYSTVYDLKNGLVYVYYYHNFNQVKVFNLTEEFTLGYHSYSIPDLFTSDSQPPNTPDKPIGPVQIEKGIQYHYLSVATDPEYDKIFYLFDWGDGTDSDWQGPFNSGETCNLSHEWNDKGTYKIKVKVRDIHGKESSWSDPLFVSLPKIKHSLTPSYAFFQHVLSIIQKIMIIIQ